MCCCDCLFVEAIKAAVEANRETREQSLAAATGAGVPTASTDRIPKRLCGWTLLALLGRRAPFPSGRPQATW